MYEELVKSLRQCAEASCAGCKNDLVEIGCRGKLQIEAADAIEGLSGLIDRYGGETGIKDLNEFAGKYWDTLAKIPRWIPVAERLPEKYDRYYLVILNNWNTDFCLYTKEKGFGMYITPKWWDANDEVTHWMPLPDPPKEVT